ncbi:MAG: YwaF family protein [Bacilli bacterium]|nr:YwaF family protein [Bacilli bacterium]
MSIFERIVYFLQGKMDSPVSYGWFHLLWILLSFITIYILYKKRNNHSDKQLKLILGIYGVIALILEILKQISWSFNYDINTGIITWDYTWYSAPFQLCTTPIYVSLICLFLKDGNVRKSLLSYLAFITILGSIVTMIIPDSCFTSDILVNIHTMWLHCGSFVVSVYLLISREVELNISNLFSAIRIFLISVFIALVLNIIVYNSGVLNKEEFNMFYISPYFISTLPVFSTIQMHVHYIVYLITYIWILIIGSFIVYVISILISKIFSKLKGESYEKDN